MVGGDEAHPSPNPLPQCTGGVKPPASWPAADRPPGRGAVAAQWVAAGVGQSRACEQAVPLVLHRGVEWPDVMSRQGRRLQRWVCAALAAALAVLAVSPGLAWRCADGHLCDVACTMPHGALAPARPARPVVAAHSCCAGRFAALATASATPIARDGRRCHLSQELRPAASLSSDGSVGSDLSDGSAYVALLPASVALPVRAPACPLPEDPVRPPGPGFASSSSSRAPPSLG